MIYETQMSRLLNVYPRRDGVIFKICDDQDDAFIERVLHTHNEKQENLAPGTLSDRQQLSSNSSSINH